MPTEEAKIEAGAAGVEVAAAGELAEQAELTELADFARWCDARRRTLAAPDSWLGVIGLTWLEDGANAVGADAECPVQLPAGPAHLGDLVCRAGIVFWQPLVDGVCLDGMPRPAGGSVPLNSDSGGEPTRLAYGAWEFFVIERDERLAVRLRDRDWAARRLFAGLDYFPYAATWRIDAEWQPRPGGAAGGRADVPEGDAAAWQAAFTVGDTAVTLLPMSVSAAGVAFAFRDATSGRDTYAAGRFLQAPPPADGRITLDFNRAFNPPCAFTPFATCPLPPPENRLSFAVAAGERSYIGEG